MQIYATVLNSIGSSFVSNEFDMMIMQHLKTGLSENAYTQLFYAMCFNCNTSIPYSFALLLKETTNIIFLPILALGNCQCCCESSQPILWREPSSTARRTRLITACRKRRSKWAWSWKGHSKEWAKQHSGHQRKQWHWRHSNGWRRWHARRDRRNGNNGLASRWKYC